MTEHPDKEKEEERLPTRIIIKGGLTSSERIANGVRFQHDDLAALASQPVEGPFVIDHSMGLSGIAGQVLSIKAERRTIEVPIVRTKDPKSPQVRKENATFLSREAVLTPENPAFELAARTIIAHQKAGKVPHTSIALQASRLIFDEEADEIRLGGPMRFIHDSLVSRGAFSPVEDGVGAMEISAEFSASPVGTLSATAYDSEGAVVATMSAGSVLVQNLPDLVAAYSIMNSGNPRAMAALFHAGLVASNVPESIAEPSNTIQALDGNRSLMADPVPEPQNQATQSADNGLAAELAALRAEQAKTAQTLAALAQEREAERLAAKEAEEAAVKARRASLCEELDIEDGVIPANLSLAQLDQFSAFTKSDRRNFNGGGARGTVKAGAAPHNDRESQVEVFYKELEDSDKQWQAEMANWGVTA